MTTTYADTLDRPYPLSAHAITAFREHGFVHLKDVLSAGDLDH